MVCRLDMGIGKYLEEELSFKSSLWQVLGLVGARPVTDLQLQPLPGLGMCSKGRVILLETRKG